MLRVSCRSKKKKTVPVLHAIHRYNQQSSAEELNAQCWRSNWGSNSKRYCFLGYWHNIRVCLIVLYCINCLNPPFFRDLFTLASQSFLERLSLESAPHIESVQTYIKLKQCYSYGHNNKFAYYLAWFIHCELAFSKVTVSVALLYISATTKLCQLCHRRIENQDDVWVSQTGWGSWMKIWKLIDAWWQHRFCHSPFNNRRRCNIILTYYKKLILDLQNSRLFTSAGGTGKNTPDLFLIY